MACYNDYKKYHEALKNTNFSELSNMIVQIELSSNNYDELSNTISNVEWEGTVKNALSLKIGVLTNSIQALQEEITVNVGMIVNIGKQLLELLESMKANQANYDSSFRTINELGKKKGMAKKTAEELSPFAANYLDAWETFFSIERKYEAAVKDRSNYQIIINGQAEKANELIRKLQEISFGANIDGILSETVIYEKLKEDLGNTTYIMNFTEGMNSNDMINAIRNLINNLEMDTNVLILYIKKLDHELSAANVNISLLTVGTPEYMEAYSYQSNLVELQNKVQAAYNQRLEFKKMLEDYSYNGGWFGWNKGELYSAIESGDMNTVNSIIERFNSQSREFITVEDIATPLFAETFNNDYTGGISLPKLEEFNNNKDSLLKIKVQEGYVNAAVNGNLENIGQNIQKFSMDYNNKTYTYEYNTLDKAYTLISVNVDGNVTYFDGSLG
jgi:hypothetical protein